MKFFYVYVLQNTSKDFLYVGYSEDLRSRLARHNAGLVQSTKHYIPLVLIHYEAYNDVKDAKRREAYLKTNKGKKTLLTMLAEYFSSVKRIDR